MVNKFDLLEEKWHLKAKKYMMDQMRIFTGEKTSIPIFFVSAKTG